MTSPHVVGGGNYYGDVIMQNAIIWRSPDMLNQPAIRSFIRTGYRNRYFRYYNSIEEPQHAIKVWHAATVCKRGKQWKRRSWAENIVHNQSYAMLFDKGFQSLFLQWKCAEQNIQMK
jgi:hypothetical protein